MKNYAMKMCSVKRIERTELEMPVAAADQVVVKIEYCGICGSDMHFFQNGAIGTRKAPPDFILGHESEDAVEKVMEYTDGEGCDIVFETAGSPVTLASTWKYVKTAGVIVNVGNASGEIPFVFGELARKEVDIRSVWRYRNIYPIAIEAVRTGKIDLKHIEPAMFPFEKSQEAFEYAFEHRSEVLKTIIQVTE